MALQLPDSFKREIQSQSTSLIPLVKIGDDIYISTNSITFDGQHYKPLLMTVPTLKESIDLEKRKYKVSNLTLKINNYPYNGGDRFSDSVDGTLTNVPVNIYWVSPSGTTIDDALFVYNGVAQKYDMTSDDIRLVVEDKSQSIVYRDLPLEKINVKDVYKYVPMVYGRVNNSPALLDLSSQGTAQVWLDSKEETMLVEKAEGTPYHNTFNNVPLSSLKIYGANQYLNVTRELVVIHETYEAYTQASEPLTGDNDIDTPETALNVGTEQYHWNDDKPNIIILENTSLLRNKVLQCVSTSVPRVSSKFTIPSGPSQALEDYSTVGVSFGDEEGVSTDISDHGEGSHGSGVIENIIDQDSETNYNRNYVGLYESYSTGGTFYPSNGYAPVYELQIDCSVSDSIHNHVVGLALIDVNGDAHIIPLQIDGLQKWWAYINPLTSGDLFTWDAGQKSIRTSNALASWQSNWTNQGFNNPNFPANKLVYFAGPWANTSSGNENTSLFVVQTSANDSNSDYNTPILAYQLGVDSPAVFQFRNVNWAHVTGEHWTRMKWNLNGVETVVSTDIDDPLDKDFYVDVIGRLGEDTTILAVIEDIVKDLNSTITVDTTVPVSNDYLNWKLDFTIHEKINSRKLLENIISVSPFVPRFDSESNFTFTEIPLTGGTLTAELGGNEIIKQSDVIQFSFKQTNISDIKTKVVVFYNWDYAKEDFTSQTVPIVVDETYPFEYYGLPKSEDGDYEQTPSYDPHATTTLVVDDERGKFIRDHLTASKYAQWTLDWYKHPHLKVKLKLPLKYLNLTVGDIVKFDSLLGDIKPYGIDYTADSIYIAGHGGAYKHFMVINTDKKLEHVNLEVIMMHKLRASGWSEFCSNPEFNVDCAGVPCGNSSEDCDGVCDGTAVIDCHGNCSHINGEPNPAFLPEDLAVCTDITSFNYDPLCYSGANVVSEGCHYAVEDSQYCLVENDYDSGFDSENWICDILPHRCNTDNPAYDNYNGSEHNQFGVVGVWNRGVYEGLGDDSLHQHILNYCEANPELCIPCANDTNSGAYNEDCFFPIIADNMNCEWQGVNQWTTNRIDIVLTTHDYDTNTDTEHINTIWCNPNNNDCQAISQSVGGLDYVHIFLPVGTGGDDYMNLVQKIEFRLYITRQGNNEGQAIDIHLTVGIHEEDSCDDNELDYGTSIYTPTDMLVEGYNPDYAEYVSFEIESSSLWQYADPSQENCQSALWYKFNLSAIMPNLGDIPVTSTGDIYCLILEGVYEPDEEEVCDSALGNITGDTNASGDPVYNILDLVQLANCTLALNCHEYDFACAADMNGDGNINVLDIVILANCILDSNCAG